MFPGTHASTTPDKAAVVVAESGEVLTYRELEDGSVRLARALHEHGLRPGDVVAVLAENSAKVFEFYWATQRSGLYYTPINHHLSAAEAAYIVTDSGAKALIVSAGLADVAAEVAALAPGPDLMLAYGGAVAGYQDHGDVVAIHETRPLADQPRGTEMLYSSGTTGRPKGIRPPLPPRQVDEPGDTTVKLFGPMYGFDADTVYYTPAPLYHTAPLRFGATVHALGGTVVIAGRFDARASLAAIEEYRVTHSQWVPTMFIRMLKLPAADRAGYDLSSQRVAIHAAAPCPIDVKRAMIDWWGPVVYEYYSSTESNGLTSITPQEWLRKPGSVGREVLGRIRICAEDGAVVPAAEIGTVYFERTGVPFRYHGDQRLTSACQHPDHPNWTTTGDIGYVDEDGYLFLTDRKAFVIISGGVNIYPQEIENTLALHPSVSDVAVIGVPHPEMGQEVRAFVQPSAGSTPSPQLAQELIDYVRTKIAHFKAPRSVEFVAELPRTEAGKLAKHLLIGNGHSSKSLLSARRPEA